VNNFSLETFNTGIITRTMFRTNLKISIRTLLKQKRFAVINLLGLTLGLTACLFIFFYVLFESSYDKTYPKHEHIVRVPMVWNFGETSVPSGDATSAAGVVLKEVYPEIINFVRIRPGYGDVFQKGQDKYEERDFVFADTSFLSIFDIPLIQGNKATALKEPNSLVLSVKTAEKYFGPNWNKRDITGEEILINNTTNYLVTGVMENLPANSHMSIDILGSFSTLRDYKNPNWDNSNFTTYLLLNDESMADLEATSNKFNKELAKLDPNNPDMVQVHLEKLSDIYLKSNFNNHLGNKSDIKYLYIFSAVGILILLMACINYVNMTTAHALNRAKEVGMKKVSGANKADLFWQFIFESAFLIILSTGLSFLLIFLLSDLFYEITNISITPSSFLSLKPLILLLTIIFAVTIFSGIYPAVILSGFEPVKVLKGKFSYSAQGRFLRKSLVVFQFAISMFLIAFTYIIFLQMQLIQEQNLGYEKENTLILPSDDAITKKREVIRAQFLSLTDVKNVTFASLPPINIMSKFAIQRLDKTSERQLATYVLSDQHYLETFDLKLIAGKGFHEITYPDSGFVMILNNTAMEFFGWDTESVLGKELLFWGDTKGEVIGVTEDFNFQSLKTEIEPLCMISSKEEVNFGYQIMVKLDKSANTKNTLLELEKIWNEVAPHYPFDYRFMDAEYERLYKSETRLNKLFITFSLLAVIIAFLGITGLAAFNTTQRFKEISIRKVLGASMPSIFILLSKDYLLLLTISLCCAVPICHYFTTEWLSNFAYQTSLSWWVYFLPAILVAITALLAVSLQSVKAVISNPAEILRSE